MQLKQTLQIPSFPIYPTCNDANLKKLPNFEALHFVKQNQIASIPYMINIYIEVWNYKLFHCDVRSIKKKISIINIRVKKELRAEMIKMTHLMDTDPTLNPVLRHKVTSNRGFGFGFRKSQVFSQFFELRRTRTTKCNWVGGKDYVLRSTRVISCSDPVISCHLSFLKTLLSWFLTVFICLFIFSSLSLL